MSLPAPCERCGRRYKRAGKRCRYCEECIRKQFITSWFNKRGKFKDCNDLKEAIKKYGHK